MRGVPIGYRGGRFGAVRFPFANVKDTVTNPRLSNARHRGYLLDAGRILAERDKRVHPKIVKQSAMKIFGDKKILEQHSDGDTTAVSEAISFCGRIFADLGAAVHVDGTPRYRSRSARTFLGSGKIEGVPSGAVSLSLRGTADPLPAPEVRLSMLPRERGGSRSSEFTLMAVSGLLDIVGDPARAPLSLPAGQLARAAGLAAFTAAAAQLFNPDGPAHAEISLLDVGIWLNWKSLVLARENGVAPSRLGPGAEWQVIACRDGWIGLVYRENDWVALKELVGDARLDVPLYDLRANRKAHSAEIAAIVGERFAAMSREEIMDFASKRRIPLGPVLTTTEVIEDEQSIVRGAFVTHDGIATPRLPVLWNGRPLETTP